MHLSLPASPGPLGTAVVPSLRAPELIGYSPQVQELRELALRAAAGPVKVLITGESGVGKDLLARYIHAHSSRSARQMVAVNCAGLTDTLLESELFGHRRGSFTGAHKDKQGKLQLAHGSTVFLDEVGEMTLRMQALLLRFLENGEIQPVGSDAVCARVDARVIAATNRDLSALVAAGSFREDLYYRLNVVRFRIPPLRERPEDIRPIIRHLATAAGRDIQFTPEAFAALESYRWTGNVRELQNVLEHLMWMRKEDLVTLQDLPAHVHPQLQLMTRPAGERRRQIADDVFEALRTGHFHFWEHVHPLFVSRDLTRHDLRELVRRGLKTTGGSYRDVTRLFGMADGDYKRFLNFLAAHDCTVDYREYRVPRPASADAEADGKADNAPPPRALAG